MGMIVVRGRFVSCVLMVVFAVLAVVRVLVDGLRAFVAVGVLVFVRVIMGVGMFVLVGMLADARMLMLMFMLVRVLVDMLMLVFVVAFHSASLFPSS